MKKYDVIIFIEHIVRELEAAVLLSKELEKRGLSSIIKSTFYDYYDVLKNYECNILVVPWCYNDKNYRFFSNIKCKSILNLHHEQIDTIKENKLLPNDRAKYVYHLSWGNVFTHELINSGVEKDFILQCGSVRIDFYDKKFKDLSLSKNQLAKKYSLNLEKKWILIAGNFPKIYFLDYEKQSYKFKISKVAVKSYEKTMVWIDKLCNEINSEYEVIYRPHPTESKMLESIQLSDKHDNFHFIRSDNIRDWIINSDIVYAWRSTSAIDAIFAGKKIFLIRPEFIDEEYELPILNNMLKIENYEMFLDTVKSNIYELKARNENLMIEINNRYDQNVGSSYKKIVDRIYEIFVQKPTKSLVDNYKPYKINDFIYLMLKDLIKQRLGFFSRFNRFKGFENFIHERITNEHLKEIEKKIENIIY